MQTNKPYTDEFKRSVVEHWLESGKSAAESGGGVRHQAMELAGLAFQVRASAKGARGSDARVARSHAAGAAALAQGTRTGDFPAGDSKKNFRDRLGSVEERYGCIQEHCDEHSIVDLCELLAVAKSGYYAWCKKAQSKQESMNEELLKMITEIFAEHHGRYGSPRITKALRQCGWKCNHKRVERLMHEQGLQARVRKRWKPRTTDSRHPHPIAPNLLLNQPAPTSINQVWVQDITYLPTAEGWLYLAGVLDLYSRRLIGWSMQQTLETSLPLAALQMAVERAILERSCITRSWRKVCQRCYARRSSSTD